MKKQIYMIPLLGLLLASTGCVSVKTEHKIQPISITVDINLKVQQELEDFFGDIYGDSSESSATE